MMLTQIRLDHESRIPLYLQISEQIKDMILNELLPEGKRLLPTRELAVHLEVNRSTVVSAYNQLIDEGFIESKVGKGTNVKKKTQLSEADFNHEPMNWSEFFYAFPNSSRFFIFRDRQKEAIHLFSQEDIISFGAGVPDPKFYPVSALEKIISKLLKYQGETVLQLSPVEGSYILSEALARWMSQEGHVTRPDEILITSGAIQGLYLVVETLLSPNDLVVMETPTAMNALWTFRAAEVKIIDIPVDEEGMRVDILENVLSRQKIKAIYTVPTFQNPSGTVLSLARRRVLLEMAHKYRIPIIEDDPYSQLYFDHKPPPSLKALDTQDIVIHLGTFSKILFPGFRIGWVCAPKQVIRHMTPLKQIMDLSSNTLEQCAFAELLKQGLMEKHLAKIRKVYAKKKDLMIQALSKCCSSTLSWNEPEGGFYLWCRLMNGLNSSDLLSETSNEKVAFMEGKSFSPKENSEDRLRLNFSFVDENLIEEGIHRLGLALSKLRKRYEAKPIRADVSTKPIV